MNRVKEFFISVSDKILKCFSKTKKTNIAPNNINFNLYRASSSSASMPQSTYLDYNSSSGQNVSANAHSVKQPAFGKQKYDEFLDKVQKIEDKNIAAKSGELIFNEFQIINIKNKVNNSLVNRVISYDANKIITILLKNFKDNDELINYVEKKFSNNTFRFAKNNAQERTAVIAFGVDGEMKLVGTHNQKLAGDREGEKNYLQAFRGKGTFKKVKSAYDLTFSQNGNGDEGEVLARASIVVGHNKIDSILELELLFSTFANAKNIVIPKAISAPFVRKKDKSREVVVHVFYDSAECTLVELFSDEAKRIELLGEDENELYKEMLYNNGPVPESVKRILLQIAEGIKEIHDQDYVHQDIKPQNILIFKKNVDGERLEINAKITDFGLTVLESNRNNGACYTAFVAAPEIFSAYSNPNKQDHAYYFNYQCSCYGRNVYQATENYPQRLTLRSNKLTDIWAFGIVSHIILTGTTVKDLSLVNSNDLNKAIEFSKNKYNFIAKSLEILPENRPKIDELIELLNSELYPRQSSELKLAVV